MKEEKMKNGNHVNWINLMDHQKKKKHSNTEPPLHGSSPNSEPPISISTIDVLEYLEKKPIGPVLNLFLSLSTKQQVEIFSLLRHNDLKLLLYKNMPKKEFAKIFVELSPSIRFDFYHLLESKEYTHLLPYLSKTEREKMITHASYLPDTAGSVMRTNMVIALYSMTVGEVLDKTRLEASTNKLFYYTYVVDEDMKLLGCVSLKDLIVNDTHEHIGKISKVDLVYASIDDTKEDAAKKIEKYDLIALPILNNKKQIVGIIPYDDAMDIIRAEQGEDANLLMGIDAEEFDSSYLITSSGQHLRKRIKWIVIVFMASIVSQAFLHAKNAFFLYHGLILYVGMITDSGGNVGNQAASVVLQALNRGQVTLSDWFKIILKEIEIALMIAFVLFVLTFIKLYVITSIDPDTTRNLHVMFIVAFSMALQIICSAVIGASLPLAAKYFKGDPAVASNPVINTTVELLGTIIYYTVIYCFLNPVNESSPLT